MRESETVLQFVWGVALVMAGVGVFFRIPHMMSKVETIEQFSHVLFFIQLSFYLLGVLLISGGLRKIYDNYKNRNNGSGI